MIVDLQRAHTPQEMGAWECGLCGRGFEVESVIAEALTPERYEIGRLCPDCVEHFGRRNPELYPTIERYRELVRRYPAPVWPSPEAAEAAEADGSFDAAYEASWLYCGGTPR